MQGVLASWVSLHARRVGMCACGLSEPTGPGLHEKAWQAKGLVWEEAGQQPGPILVLAWAW